MLVKGLLGGAVCATALALAPVAAAAGPSGLRVVELRASGATLSWQPATGDVYGYSIRDLLSPETGNQVGYSFSTTGTATLKPRTTYRLAVVAGVLVRGELVDSPFSNAVTVTTPADTTPPTQPRALGTGQTATSATVLFHGATDDVGIDSWVISNGERTWTHPAWQQWQFTATGLQSNRTHTLTVRARDAAGNLSPPSAAVTFELEDQPPTAPQNLRVEGDHLVWDASQDNVRVVGYDIFVDGGAFPSESTTNTRSSLRLCEEDDPTSCFPSTNEPHTYVVRARDPSRNLSPPSAPLTVNPR